MNELPADTSPRVPQLQGRSLGKAIRELRKASRTSIADLAKAIDRSTGYVSQIERDLSTPTLKDLFAICLKFSVPMSWFVPENCDRTSLPEDKYVVRAAGRRRLDHKAIFTEVLLPELNPRFEFMQSTFPPGVTLELKSIVGAGIEAGYILKGQLEMCVGSTRFTLHEGDSYSFSREENYHSRNPSKTDSTIVIWIGLST